MLSSRRGRDIVDGGGEDGQFSRNYATLNEIPNPPNSSVPCSTHERGNWNPALNHQRYQKNRGKEGH